MRHFSGCSVPGSPLWEVLVRVDGCLQAILRAPSYQLAPSPAVTNRRSKYRDEGVRGQDKAILQHLFRLLRPVRIDVHLPAQRAELGERFRPGLQPGAGTSKLLQVFKTSG